MESHDGQPERSEGSIEGSAELRSDEAGGEGLVDELVEAGVLVESDGDLALGDDFGTRWRAGMAAVREADLAERALAAVPAVTEAELVTETADPWLVLSDGSGAVEAEAWLSPPVAVAEIAAVESLVDVGLDRSVAVGAAAPLRLFLERCPICETPLERGLEGCGCGPGEDPTSSPEDDVLLCPACDVRLYTFRG